MPCDGIETSVWEGTDIAGIQALFEYMQSIVSVPDHLQLVSLPVDLGTRLVLML